MPGSRDLFKLGTLGKVKLAQAIPIKSVNNAGDWTIAWNATTIAYTHAFLWKQEELNGYAQYIL